MEAPAPQRRPLNLTLADLLLAGLVVAVAGGLILLLLPPVQTDVGRPASRTQCKNNLKQLALALHNYHDDYGSFPPAYIADKNGRPMHSWRVLLLPYLEYRPLYNEYRFDEPWNGPHNRELAAKVPSIYRCPKDDEPAGNTSYCAVVGPKTVFPGAATVRISDILDGTANAILLVEAAESGINWLEPRDVTYEEALRGINAKDRIAVGISSHHEGGAQIALADGSVRFLPNDTPLDQIRLLLERNDGQELRLPSY